jgi:predicted  nucleic acid-binding Zn-ribbon protein
MKTILLDTSVDYTSWDTNGTGSIEMIDDLVKRMRDPRWVKHHPEAADVIEQLWNALKSAMEIHHRRTKELEDALEDALDEWAYCSSYKGDYMQKKHRDLEQVEDYRKLLPKKVESKDET